MDDHQADGADFGGREEADAASAGAFSIAGREADLVAAEVLAQAGNLHRDEHGRDLQVVERFDGQWEVLRLAEVDPFDHLGVGHMRPPWLSGDE